MEAVTALLGEARIQLVLMATHLARGGNHRRHRAKAGSVL